MASDSSLLYDLPAITLRRISVSEMNNNVYLLTAKKSGVQVLIDAADDAGAIRSLLASAAADTPCPLQLSAVLTTHAHWDHIRALEELLEAPAGAPAASTADATDSPTPAGTGQRPGARPESAAGAEDAVSIEAEKNVTIDRRLRHGDTVSYDGIALNVIHLRGHTPGSVAFVYPVEDGPTHIFTGDSLFPGGVGKTWSDADFSSLLDDVEARLFDVYEDDTIIHPGHGDPTTLGAERASLPAWRERGW
ncbi:MBL fold metallo-hydrolase [Nesterenkonia sandarakina]|uniref:Glyoxylase-like metal-dependent hydrolase (Beta-lactamase superfamily II) n=1 Tax=Nesterenkonia sandarakina TaxID=272918 RepID=A0A7Z0E9J2_9MICC|nr:MBL fold metallo-hydrolase [Nesterenkonia sandarakina]NYJ17439.1 glyoxylase-like metal-dependent hydrolase (beta-lactamase superfamily II) [Nesterenkonia sandarakina]